MTATSLRDVPLVVAVGSGKGGVGKSTITANLAVAATRLGVSSAILDADVHGPDIPAMFGITRRRPAQSLLLASRRRRLLEPLERHGVRLMSTQFFVSEDQAVAWSSTLVSMLIRRFVEDVDWSGVDVVFVDLPPGTADIQQQLAGIERLARIPLAPAVATAAERGRPLVLTDPGSAEAELFAGLARRVLAR